MGRIVRVWIDENICLAHGICVDECAEVFDLPTGQCVAKVRPEAEQFYLTKDAEIRSAVGACPVECIHIKEVAEC